MFNNDHEGAAMSIRILRLPEVKAATGLSRSTIYSQMIEGCFPKPISLGARAVGWVNTDIEQWLSSRIADSKEKTA
jgi:prophage regulatory protein